MKNSKKLLAGISQEIRTYMNAIVGFSFLLEEANSGKRDDCTYSNQILNSCKKLMWLIESYFEVSTDDKSNLAINLKKCLLNNFLDSIISDFRELMDQNNNSDIVLSRGNQHLDLSEVYFDSTKVSRVINCLIHNAINNSKTGHIRVGYNLYLGKVTFYILDSGQDYLKCREFLQMEDMENSIVEFIDGSSVINIMMAKEIVTAMGGIIWFDPNENRGTGAYFSIPIITIECTDSSIKNSLKSIVIDLN